MFRRDEMTWVRLTTGERAALEAAAARAGKRLSTWIRQIALEEAQRTRRRRGEAAQVADDFAA